jgi:hypothetical protein
MSFNEYTKKIFFALDTENKNYLIKKELLEII